MTTTREAYAPVDVHAKAAPGWPATIPPMTAPEAVRAARRLWRWALRETFGGRVEVTSGNRYTYGRWKGDDLVLFVNPTRGWRNFAHELSHFFWARANPGERPHSKAHARFEARLVAEIVGRGWLDGRLREVPAPPSTLDDRRRRKLEAIDARIERWTAKQRRADTALAKLAKQRRYYARAIGEQESE